MLPIMHLETNPIFLNFGLWGLIIIKIIILLLVWCVYSLKNYGEWISFIYCFFLVQIIYIMGYFGVLINVIVFLNPEILNQSIQVLANDNLTNYYKKVMIFYYCIPMILGILSFWVHKDNLRYLTWKKK